MKIAILNEVFLKDEHLEKLRNIGEITVYERTDTEDKVIERLEGVEIAIADCWEAPLNKAIFESISSVKYLTIGSTGYDLVDVQAARENNVLVSNIPGFSTDAVAEHSFALLLAVMRRIVQGDQAMRAGPFQIDPANQEQNIYKGENLIGKTIGIVGLGQIGQRIAQIAGAFGMRVIAYNRTPKQIAGVEIVELEDLLRQSDVVSINTALGNNNKELINESALSLMKPTAYLINTARGGLVNEEALAKALGDGQLAGAGLDLLNNWSLTNSLLKLPNVVLSPHTAFFTSEALEKLADIVVANVEAYANGKPQNLITG